MNIKILRVVLGTKIFIFFTPPKTKEMPKVKMPRSGVALYYQSLGLDASAAITFDQAVALVALRDSEINENTPCEIEYEQDEEGERMMDTE